MFDIGSLSALPIWISSGIKERQGHGDLRLSGSVCLQAKSPHASCRESSSFEVPCFRGDYRRPSPEAGLKYPRSEDLPFAALTPFAPAQWAGQQSAAAMFANLLGENRGR